MRRPLIVLVVALTCASVCALACAAGTAGARARPGNTATSRRIVHQPVDTMLTGRALILRATLGEDFVQMAQLRLYYRWGESGDLYRKTMTDDGQGSYRGCIPGRRLADTHLQYYLEAVDVRGKRVAGFGTRRRPVRVRMALAPTAPSDRRASSCADGVGRLAITAPPSRSQLRRLAFRKRALALEARGLRLRGVGRGLVIGGLVALAVGAVFLFRGLSEGPVFIGVGAGIAGVAALVTLIGAPCWVAGSNQVKRALRQLVKPEARAPARLKEIGLRPGSTPTGGARRAAVFGWRFRF